VPATTRETREQIARRRLVLVLRAQGVAVARTLEQKISDAGPNPMRIDPHILTPVRNAMVREGRIIRLQRPSGIWFHLDNTPQATVDARLQVLEPIYTGLHQGDLGPRIGQTLEIAIFHALRQQTALSYVGGFPDLHTHDDSTLYSKSEPPASINGQSLGDERLDFVAFHPIAGAVGIEAKNVREWVYPHRSEITEALAKCVTVNCVPVIIARRIHFSAFLVLSRCGVLFHQMFTQLVPNSIAALAAQAKHKNLLGFHDLRVGNIPDARLVSFVGQNLPNALPDARTKFDAFQDLLRAYTLDGMSYDEFSARVRRRTQGVNEDSDDTEP
jgi:hypothetical protein